MKRYHPLFALAATAALAALALISAPPARAQDAESDSERRIECNEQRLARASVRAAARATARAVSSLPPGAMLTPNSLIFVDGPEVPLDWIEWADDIGSRRVHRPMVTDTVLKVGPGTTLALANLNGDIDVQVWDRNEVRIRAEHDRSDRIVARMYATVLKLGVRSRDGQTDNVEWKLTVPSWLPLDLSGMESEIAVTGMHSAVTAQSVRGDVLVRGCRGPLEANSVEGEVHVEDVSGNVSAGSVNSIIRIVRVTGPVEAQTINGDIQLERLSSPNVDASTVNGRVYFASTFQPHGRYAFASHNGNLYVGVPSDQHVNVTLSSFNGQVESSIPVPPQAPHARGRTVRFTTGDSHLLPRTPRAPRAPRAPQVPELELESFGGLIQLASQEEVLRAIDRQRAALDSARSSLLRARREMAARARRVAKAPEAPPSPPNPETPAPRN